MSIDFAIVYFGLTRSTRKVYTSHIANIFNILEQNNLSYKKFMHTWKTSDNKQYIWDKIIREPIDYNEYMLLSPDYYKIDSQDDFLNNVNMDNYFYKDAWDKKGNSREGEWLVGLVRNHICALESMKRGIEMVEGCMINGDTFKYIMFIRPDIEIKTTLPLNDILSNQEKITIANFEHYEGYNDRFAIMNYNNACIYGKRIDELADFRKVSGRIVSEKYVKYIIDKYNLQVNFINFNFDIIRP